jgi:mRNA-degrading endonuclease toxin of MazEF toxin-antitoxin module
VKVYFQRGDVVVVDFGMVGKQRPAVVVSIPGVNRERNMSVVVPLTMEIRGGPSEVAFKKPAWLQAESAANVLGLAGVDNSKIVHRIGVFPAMAAIETTLKRVLGLGLEDSAGKTPH